MLMPSLLLDAINRNVGSERMASRAASRGCGGRDDDDDDDDGVEKGFNNASSSKSTPTLFSSSRLFFGRARRGIPVERSHDRFDPLELEELRRKQNEREAATERKQAGHEKSDRLVFFNDFFS